MPENGTTDIKVQLAGLKKDIENVSNLNSRLDLAIEKLTDVSTSIKSMLAVHEEKIQRQEQIDDIIFDKLKERAESIDEVHKDLTKEIQQVEILSVRWCNLQLKAHLMQLLSHRHLHHHRYVVAFPLPKQ